MSQRVKPGPTKVADDFQKHRWGGKSHANGRRLRALFLGGSRTLFEFSLVVESTDGSPLQGPFYFHLHDTFKTPTYTIQKVHLGRFAIFEEATAYETFTAAVEVKDRRGNWLGLELDLEEVPEIPPGSKPPSFRLERSAGTDGRRGGERTRGRGDVLQKLITNNRLIKNPVDWREAWMKAEQWVCRIRLGTRVIGTGVLVGPNLVLTNWHVVKGAPLDQGDALSFEFDFVYGKTLGRPYPFVRSAQKSWLLDYSPCTTAEEDGRPSALLPRLTELDFALVALEPISKELGDLRGFAKAPAFHTFQTGDPLIILQHPRGDPQCFALDQEGVIGLNANGTRLMYSTNTEPGSSGSPCFDMDWQFIALHHAGFSDRPGSSYNQGIPTEALKTQIAAAQAKLG